MESQLASLDGEIVPSAQACIPVTDEGLLRGDGVFEVMRLYGGVPFAREEHLARMRLSAQRLRLPLDLSALETELEQLLTSAQPGDALLRIVATRGEHRIALIEPLPDLPASISLKSVEYAPVRLLDGIKSLSYAANMLATRRAREDGCDDALLVTPHGRVLECPTASFFWVCEGEILTPPLSDHLLDSITRRLVLEVAGAREHETAREELYRADEAFIASSVREVLPVASIDASQLQAPGPLTAAAAERVRAEIAARLRAG